MHGHSIAGPLRLIVCRSEPIFRVPYNSNFVFISARPIPAQALTWGRVIEFHCGCEPAIPRIEVGSHHVSHAPKSLSAWAGDLVGGEVDSDRAIAHAAVDAWHNQPPAFPPRVWSIRRHHVQLPPGLFGLCFGESGIVLAIIAVECGYTRPIAASPPSMFRDGQRYPQKNAPAQNRWGKLWA
jgi:hypothetical protein